MFNKFKNSERVIVYGSGEEDGKFYNFTYATVIERDPYYKDYHLKFDDGSEDWMLPKYIHKLAK